MSVGRYRHRWEAKIKIDLKEIGLECCGLDSSGIELGSVIGFCEHDNEL
jgi:hypothetical protein